MKFRVGLTGTAVGIVFIALLCFSGCNLNPDRRGDDQWIKTFGIIEEDSGADVAVDAFGNVYVVGMYTAMANMGFEHEPYYLTADDDSPNVKEGKNYIYLIKYAPNGRVIWSKNFKTNNTETNLRTMAIKLALDFDAPVPAVYITGFFSGNVNFDPDGDEWIRARSERDVFISKYHAQNGSYLWTRTLGGPAGNRFVSRPTDIKAGGGAVYLTGLFHDTIYLNTDHFSAHGTPDQDWLEWRYVPNNSPEISFTIGGITYSYQNVDNTFVLKLDANGDFVWGKGLPTFAGGLAIDQSRGVLYVTGGFLGTIDIDPGPGGRVNYDESRFLLTATTADVLDIFVTALYLRDGGHAGWADAYGKAADTIGAGTTDDLGVEMALDQDGNIYLIGMMRRRPRHWHLVTMRINGPGHPTDPYALEWEKYNTNFWWDYPHGTDYRLLYDWTPKLVIREPYIYIAGCYSDPFDTQNRPSGTTLRGFRAEYGWGPGGNDISGGVTNDRRPADDRDIFVTRRHIEHGTYMGTMVSGGERTESLRGFDVSWGRDDEEPYFLFTGVFRNSITAFGGTLDDPTSVRRSRGKTDGFVIRTVADFPAEMPALDMAGEPILDDDGEPVFHRQIDSLPE